MGPVQVSHNTHNRNQECTYACKLTFLHSVFAKIFCTIDPHYYAKVFAYLVNNRLLECENKVQIVNGEFLCE